MSKLLTCEALTKVYEKEKTALDGIDLDLGFGRIVGLLGPNGSGKTTLLKLANGLLQPTAGSIQIAGMAPARRPRPWSPICRTPTGCPTGCGWSSWWRCSGIFIRPGCFDAEKANEMLAQLEHRPKAPAQDPLQGQQGEGSADPGHEPQRPLYLLDEPIGGVDPAARDYILNTILTNYSRDAPLSFPPTSSRTWNRCWTRRCS